MSTAAERLRVMAREAIEEYNQETVGGGEPPYPGWAYDIINVLDQVSDTIDDQTAEIKRLRELLRVAGDHIDMSRLEISHCKDAALIRAALQGESKS